MKKTETEQNLTWPKVLVLALGTAVTVFLLAAFLQTGDTPVSPAGFNIGIVQSFEQNLNNQISDVLDGVIPIQRIYVLNDSDMAAPDPDPDAFLYTQDPMQLESLLEKASGLMQGQETLFSTETVIKEGSTVHAYLDETIFAVTWKQVIDDCTYTFSEVKIAHPSQLRRFLSEGKYDSGILHTTTEMSESVNAVVASSGDYYDYRSIGIVVNEGKVYRDRGHFLDTLYVNDKGEFLFTYAGEITDRETAQKFVDEHNIRFSLCFGPVMILDGEYRVPNDYNSGEINSHYSRAALCSLGDLHYLVVAANSEDPNYYLPKVSEFGWNLYELGIRTAYALDGGQTAAIVMNDELINTVSYGSQREISDIVYFATAFPERKEK